MCSTDCLLVLIGILFPPLPVWVKRGLCSADSLINIALCCLGFVPGMLHAWYIIFSTPDEEYYYEQVPDAERGQIVPPGNRQVNYYYVSHGAPAPRQGAQGQWGGEYAGSAQQPGSGAPMNYGTAQPAEQNHGGEIPPSYSDAIQGNNKVQRDT